MKWKKWEVIALILLDLVAVVAVVALGSFVYEYMKGRSTYNKLAEYVFLPEEQEEMSSTEENDQNMESSQEQQNEKVTDTEDKTYDYVYYGHSPEVDFQALCSLNSDVVGWIYGPDSTINYPVVQGTDNEYYLTHMFDGKENKCGSIFMDCLNEKDFSDSNSIIHGHHMRDGSMFAGLVKYESQSYYDSHPVFWLVTPEKSYRVELFAGFVTSTNSEVWQLEFATKDDYQSWIDKMARSSYFKSDVIPTTDDRILTIATCSYEYDDARFVVLGIMREQN